MKISTLDHSLSIGAWVSLLAFIMIACTHNNEDRQGRFESAVSSLHPSGDDEDRLFVPEGLRAEVWAKSPQFYNPTNIDVDRNGRVWVTEAVNYRDFNNDPEDGFKHFEGGDRVVILEDTNGDGRADSSKVFVQDEDLVSPLGIAVIENKVIVSSSPYLIVYTDETGNDQPDRKEKFLTGFGGLDHDHALHSLVAGPDGLWYFNTGNAGPHIVTDKDGWTLRAGSSYTGGTPYNVENEPGLISDDGRVWIGGVALRINPDGTGLKVLGHNFRNSYEITLDSYGNMWQNDNDDQISNRTTWLVEGGNAGFMSRDGSRFWRADQRPGQDIPTAHWRQEDPGVMPSGDITGAGAPTGIVLYESDALGPQYEEMLLSADAGRNHIFGYLPEPSGAGFELNRHIFASSVDESTSDYVWHNENIGEDKWFRPSDVAVGTDGSLYIADWYDPIVGGHQMRLQQGDGRIYRISPENRALHTPDLDLQSTEGQIQALLNPAINVRYSGFIRLKEQGESAVEDVKEILSADKRYHRARAVWLLANLGDAGITEAERLMQDDRDDHIRFTAFRALRQNNPERVLEYAQRLARDPSPPIRREVAIALRDIPLDESQEIILELIKGYDGEDQWYLYALGIALDGKGEEFYPVLKEEFAGNSSPEEWPEIVADLAWELHPRAAVEDLKARAASRLLPEAERKRAIVALGFVDAPEAADAMIALSEQSLSDVSREALWWLKFRNTNEWQAYLEDWEAPPPDRPLAKKPEILALNEVVNNESASIRERVQAAETMAADSVGGLYLISAAAQSKLPFELEQAISSVIFENPDRYVRSLAMGYFTRPDPGQSVNRENILSAVTDADVDRGRDLFFSNCAMCHSNGETGSSFGPSLATIRNRIGRSELLDAIIEPDASVTFGFEPWLVTTGDGRAIYGLRLSDGNITVVSDVFENRYFFNAEEIESKRQLSTTIMPDAYQLELTEDDLADLTRYLLELN
ncbi:MAG: PVC-type heme-binding CxxCH protein [Balneolaceae bacterium]